MKRSLLLLLVVAAGCQQATVPPSAGITGLRDMVRVGDYIVATSTERDELRVLYLETGDSIAPRKYVRAPNPIQALSIPVLKRPSRLVTDTAYLNGAEIGGPYVYASSQGVSQISIVWAENDSDTEHSYTELVRVSTSAPVTATAAQGGTPVPSGIADGGMSGTPDQFYYATYDGTNGTIFRFAPKGPAEIRQQPIQSDARVVATAPGETIVDMITLPGNRLAIATRNARGGGGRSIVIDGLTGAQLTTLQFPGPVRALYTHGAFSLRALVPAAGGGLEIGTLNYPDGARVYGVLDEESMCGAARCNGLVAVESDTGLRALSGPGLLLDPSIPRAQREAPVMVFGATGSATIRSLSLSPGGSVQLPPSVAPSGVFENRTLSVLGVASLSNGQLEFFFAAELQPINSSALGPAASTVMPDGGSWITTTRTAADGSPVAIGPDAGFADFVGPAIYLANGAARDELVTATANATVPGLESLSLTSSGTSFDVGDAALAQRAVVGDSIDNCTNGTVTAIEGSVLRFSMTCAGAISVRAGATNPYVVSGTGSGYMGRSSPGQRFSFALPYTTQYADYQPQRPAIIIDFPADPPLAPGEAYQFVIDDQYLPFQVTLTSAACSAGLTTDPGSVLSDPVRQRVFVAYPSSNGIVEIDPAFAFRSSLFETRLSCWR